MDKRTIEGPMVEVALRQIDGAKISSTRGMQYFIEFDLENNYKVAYVYNINANKDYFLQRVLPYPVRHEQFSNEKDLVDFIKADVAEFRNAQRSRNFEEFIKITKQLETLTDAMEALFLNYNVGAENLIQINEDFKDILKDIEKIKGTAKKIK